MERMRSGRLLAAFVVALVVTVALVIGASAKAYAREEVTWDGDQVFDSSIDTMAYVYVDKDITVTIAEGKSVKLRSGINTHSHTPNMHTITVAGKGTLEVYGDDGEIGELQEGVNGEDGKAAVFGNLIVDGATVQCTGGEGGAGEDGDTPGSGGDGAVGLTGNLTVVKGGTARVAGGAGGAVGRGDNDDAEGPTAGKPAKAVRGEIFASVIKASDDDKTYTVIEGPTTSAQYVIATSEVEPGPGPEPSPEPAESQDMFRLYNSYSGEHFYTASAEERDGLVKLGWNYEGVGWKAPAEGMPVFRLYNPYGGDHHYTVSEFERDMLVELGWVGEGVGWQSAGQDGVPVYRQYNPYATAGTHNYTTSEEEAMGLVRLGWRAEGIGWYGLQPLA